MHGSVMHREPNSNCFYGYVSKAFKNTNSDSIYSDRIPSIQSKTAKYSFVYSQPLIILSEITFFFLQTKSTENSSQ